jgi:hypothetical protein
MKQRWRGRGCSRQRIKTIEVREREREKKKREGDVRRNRRVCFGTCEKHIYLFAFGGAYLSFE